MNTTRHLFTSESVGEGHPDKLCDQISDAILDACLREDPASHVACETFASTALVLVGGEITTNTYVDVQDVARTIARDIGYTDADYGLDCDSMAVLDMIHNQSPDINQGVAGTGLDEFKGQQGAGHQGMMFGFACTETPELMPAPIMYAHALLHRATNLRKSKKLPWLRPDAKSQVTIEYDGHNPVRIDTVVISHQHDPDVTHATIKESIIEEVIKPELGKTGLLTCKQNISLIPPTLRRRWTLQIPGHRRKIIVTRTAAWAATRRRVLRKTLSAADRRRLHGPLCGKTSGGGLVERCEVQLAYAIGVPFRFP